MSKKKESRNLQHLYHHVRNIQIDIELILKKYFSWIDFFDETIVSFYAYDALIDYVGRNHEIKDSNTQLLGMSAVPGSWIIWPFIKLLYHFFLSNSRNIIAKSKKGEIPSSILLLPVTKKSPHLLSIVQKMLDGMNYSCITMTVTSSNISWEAKEIVSHGSLEYVEGLLSIKHLFQIFRTRNRVLKEINPSFLNDFCQQIFSRYNIHDENVRKIILRKIVYGLLDNIEYGLIGAEISKYRPLAVISEVVKYGKVAFIMSYLDKIKTPTIGLQHGVLINPFDYYPSSKYFGCSSLYSKKKLESIIGAKNKCFFLAGLPEQMSRNKPISANDNENKISLGIVDSTETIVLYRMQMIEIIKNSKFIKKFEDLYIKSHPRVAKGDKIEDWLSLPNFRSLGTLNWDEFSSKVNTAITFSFDAVYELLKMEKVTIMLNPANRFDATEIPDFCNLKIISTAMELDSILIDILEGRVRWNSSEESDIKHFLDYIYGKKDDDAYIQSIIKVLDSALSSDREHSL